MKFPASVWCGLAVTVIGLGGLSSLQAQAPSGDAFPGVKKALSPEDYRAAGLDKLSPEQQAKLDEALRGYFSGATRKVVEQATQQAAAQAVDRAVKEKRVEAPTLIESRIVGPVNGWGERTVFLLENGQRWTPIDKTRHSFPPLDNPQVYIVRDPFGYKMAIFGGTVVRVRRVF